MTNIQIGPEMNGHTLELRPDEAIDIRLPENNGTGYQWVLHEDGGPACKPVGQSRQINGLRPGQPGTHVWQFQAGDAGTGVIRLAYQRPWLAEDTPAQTFAVSVRVAA